MDATLPRRLAQTTCLIGGLWLAGLTMLPTPAEAQVGTPTGNMMTGSTRRAVGQVPPKAPAPPALPGAQSSGAAPSNRVPLDMPPNEALFDAVNRGDIGAVRDALGRGADLKAHNVLGITATELAIDLGRNDIAFLLLSMRGSDRPRGAARAQAATALPSQAEARAGRTGARGTTARAAPDLPPQPRVTTSRRPSTEPDYARQYANDGGTPAPSSGFLGFNERGAVR